MPLPFIPLPPNLSPRGVANLPEVKHLTWQSDTFPLVRCQKPRSDCITGQMENCVHIFPFYLKLVRMPWKAQKGPIAYIYASLTHLFMLVSTSNLSVLLSVCASTVSNQPSINPSIHLSIYLSTVSIGGFHQSVCLSIYLSICLSVCLSVYLSIYLSIYLFVYLSTCFVYLLIIAFIGLSINLSNYSIHSFINIYVYIIDSFIMHLCWILQKKNILRLWHNSDGRVEATGNISSAFTAEETTNQPIEELLKNHSQKPYQSPTESTVLPVFHHFFSRNPQAFARNWKKNKPEVPTFCKNPPTKASPKLKHDLRKFHSIPPWHDQSPQK